MKASKNTFPILLHEAASACRNLLDKRLKPLGLSQAKWRTLLNLSLADTLLTQRELAYRMGIEGATLVGLLDRLAKDGWVVRKDAPCDRRTKVVELTAKAQVALTQIRETADILRRELLKTIPALELSVCMNVLQRIKARAEELE